MMGPTQQRHSKLFYTGVSIEERIDPQHPLRKIAAVVDFQFVRRAVARLYGVRGNPSLDPILVLKMMFLLFFENVSSERELMRQLPCRLDWLWFLSMDLDSAIPDHSVLSKARRRWGPEVFAGFFKKVLGQCVAAGLVDGAKVHIDGSLIAADADAGQLTLALHLEGEAFYERLEAADKAVPSDAEAPAPATATATAPATATPTAPAIDWADSRHSPAIRRARMRRRKIRAEGSFADAANHHGYKRSRWRGLEKMTLQNLLIAAIQNVRKLIRRGKAGPELAAGRKAGGFALLEHLGALPKMPARLMQRSLTLLEPFLPTTATCARGES